MPEPSGGEATAGEDRRNGVADGTFFKPIWPPEHPVSVLRDVTPTSEATVYVEG